MNYTRPLMVVLLGGGGSGSGGGPVEDLLQTGPWSIGPGGVENTGGRRGFPCSNENSPVIPSTVEAPLNTEGIYNQHEIQSQLC